MRVRRRPISLKQIEQDEQRATRHELSLDNPVFSISNLRQPYHIMDAMTKKQLSKTTHKHKKIDDKFLAEKIKPRIVVFMADGTNLSKLKKDKY